MKALLLALCCVCAAHAAPLDTERVWADLVRWEGYKLVPYKDGTAYSVGVGHNLSANREPIKATYTAAEVRAFFYRDLVVAQKAARAGVRDFDELPERVKLICINLIWCVGPRGFQRFAGFRRALSFRAYDIAAAELADSKWAHQVSPARFNAAVRVLRSY